MTRDTCKSHLELVVMHEPREFFVPHGTYHKEEDRQLYDIVSTDPRDPLVTTPWYLVDQQVREDMLNKLVENNFKLPEFGFEDDTLKDDMGTDIVDINEDDVNARHPITPKESDRIGIGKFRPNKAQNCSTIHVPCERK